MLKKNKLFFPVLIVLLFSVLLCAIAFGAVSILPSEMFSALKHFFQGKDPASIYEGVFIQLRLPRVLLCAITGAILAVSGVLMQGLFRNPIVEPGLTGTSAGAALGASIVFVMAPAFNPAFKSFMGPMLVPLAAFACSLLATYVVYALAKNAKRVSIMSLLLIGIAVNAVCLSGTGFMSYVARDPQARSITFWNLGTFSGASWQQVFIVGSVATIIFIFALRYSKQLNTLLLGEEEAGYLGVDADKLKRRILLLNTAMVSVATAFVGVISFMGLIVPHVLRLLIGSDNKRLLPASMILGALLLVLADMCARLILAPAEVPIGIITSLVGAPIFILLLKRFNVVNEKGDTMLRTENIHYSIGKKLILNGISAQFHPGDFNMILGPNGSGKSTFLKIFSGEINKYDGKVFYADENVAQIKKEELAKQRAVMSQQPELSFPLMVEEVVMMGRYPHFTFNPNKKDNAICRQVIERMNLTAFSERNYLTLSGGEKQRVQYARVLAQVWEKPAAGYSYLFLDEPLTSLDINYQQEFLQIAREFANEHTVLIAVMHDINLAIQYADKLFFLKEGGLIAHGRPKDILHEGLIKEVFDVDVSIINNPVSNSPLVIYNNPVAR